MQRNHLARNSVMIMSNTGVTGILGFVYWGIAARSLTTHTVGVATALIAAMNLMCLIGTLGIGQTLVQRLPNADNAEWSTLMNCAVFAGAVAGAFMGAAGVFVLPRISAQFGLIRMPALAVLVVLGTSILTVASLLDCVFIAQRAAHHVLSRGLLFGVGKLILLVTLSIFIGSRGAAIILVSWVVGAAGTSVVTVSRLVPRLGRPHHWTLRGTGSELGRLIRVLILNHIISLSAALVPTVMPILVVARVSAQENAFFYISWLTANALLTVSASVAGALLAEGSHDPDRLFPQVRQSVTLITMLLLAPMLVLAVAGRPVLDLFGKTYGAHAYTLLLLFLAVVVPDAITNIYITILRVRGEHHIGAVVNVIMSVVTLAMAWVLLPKMGVTAAGWSWAAGQFVGVGVMALMISGRLMRRRTQPRSAR